MIKNAFFTSIFLASYYSYFLSLEKCYEGEDRCCKKEKWIKKKVIELFLSCIIISLLIQFMLYKKISKLNFIHLVIVFICFYNYSHGLDFENHGYFNFMGLIVVIIILLIGFIPINIFICFLKMKNKKFLLYYILSIITLYLLIFIFSNYNFTNCND